MTDITCQDISSAADIKQLVDAFYQRVNEDDLLSPVFNDIAMVDWESHLPRMYRFWETLLFDQAVYKGSPFAKHVPLPINSSHFDRWLSLFTQTVDELFSGERADHAKFRAQSIGAIFQSKLSYIKSSE